MVYFDEYYPVLKTFRSIPGPTSNYRKKTFDQIIMDCDYSLKKQPTAGDSSSQASEFRVRCTIHSSTG